MPSSIGVAAALTAEARLFPEWRATGEPPSPHAGSLALAVTGVGPQRARDGARGLLAAGAEALVSFGFAAGLAPGLPAGTVLLPRRVLAADGRASAVDAGLRAQLVEWLTACKVDDGMLAEVHVPLWEPAAKHALHLRSGAVAADMESAAIAQVAEDQHVPFVVVRAIVDGASRAIPQCARRALDGKGDVQPGALLRDAVMRPWELVALLRLARDFNIARRALACAAIALSAAAGRSQRC
jgi:adenosylhomocysteine nucleosidase